MRALLVALLLPLPAEAIDALPDTAAKIKPSIVGIGSFQQTRSPPAIFTGTGFAVADGRHVVTNAHVLPKKLDTERREVLAVLVSAPEEPEARTARVVATDPAHDLALLRSDG